MINAEFIVLSRQGDLLVASLRPEIAEDPEALLDEEPIQKALDTGSVQSTQWRDQEGELFVSVFVPILISPDDPPQGVVALFQPIAAATQAAQDILRIVIQTAGIALVLAILASFLFARRISRPAEELSDVARALGRGDLSQRAGTHYAREFAQLAEQINEMAEQIRDLLQRRTHFSAMISHEIRTPVTSIKGFVQAIQDGIIPPEEQSDYLDAVLDETRRIERLLGDLLQLERLEAGQMPLEFDWIPAERLLKEATARAAARAREQDVTLKTTPSDVIFDLWGDEERLHQVFGNLIDNAIRFSPAGAEIEVGAHIDTSHDRAQLWVADEGPGIPDQALDRIFERFYRVPKTAGDEGAGLGLAISKQIINKHGGTLWAENRTTGGAIFYFQILRTRVTSSSGLNANR